MYPATSKNISDNRVVILQTNRNNIKHHTFYSYFKPIAIFFRLIGTFPLKNLHNEQCESLQFSICSIPMLYTLILVILSLTVIVTFLDWDGIMGRLHVRFDFTTVYVLLVMLRSFNCCYFCLVRSKKFLKLVKLLHLFDLNIIEVFKENSVDDRSFLKCTIAPMIYCVVCTFFLNIELVTFFIRAISKTRFDDERFYILVATYSVMMFWQIGPMFLYQYFAFSLNINFRRMNSAFFEMFPIENWYLESISVDDIAANIKNVVKDIRQLHILMADVVKLLNRTYGLLLAVEYFFIRVAIAINLYILVFSPVNTSYMLFGSVVSAFVTLYLSDNVAKEVSFKLYTLIIIYFMLTWTNMI